MLKVYIFEFNDTFLADINGKSRIEYKKGDKVIVANREDLISLYSLGCTLILEKEIKAEDILEEDILEEDILEEDILEEDILEKEIKAKK